MLPAGEVGSPFPLEGSAVFREVTERASQWLGSARWEERCAAVRSLLVIMEYTSDYFRPSLASLFALLRPLLHDPVPAVRRKTAFFFSETADYCSDIFLDAAPFIPAELDALLASDEFDVVSALYIIESFPAVYATLDPSSALQLVVPLFLSPSSPSRGYWGSFRRPRRSARSPSRSPASPAPSARSAPPSSRFSFAFAFFFISHTQTPLLGIAQSVLLRPLRPEDVESHSYAYQLLTELLDAFGIAQLRSALPGILEAAFAAVQAQADFALSSTIFPFLSALAKQAAPGDALGVSLARFLPFLDELVFGYSEYVDVKLPSAEEEFGSLGGAFAGQPKEEGYRIVRIDAERARCKVAALETMLRIYQERQRAGETLPAEELGNVASAIVSMCAHSNAEIQYSAVRTAGICSLD